MFSLEVELQILRLAPIIHFVLKVGSVYLLMKNVQLYAMKWWVPRNSNEKKGRRIIISDCTLRTES